MTYSYGCKSCGKIWDDRYSYEDRDLPLAVQCPHCNENGSVYRTYTAAPTISYQGAHSVLKRAGSGWNDVLNKIKKASGRNAKIETR